MFPLLTFLDCKRNKQLVKGPSVMLTWTPSMKV